MGYVIYNKHTDEWYYAKDKKVRDDFLNDRMRDKKDFLVEKVKMSEHVESRCEGEDKLLDYSMMDGSRVLTPDEYALEANMEQLVQDLYHNIKRTIVDMTKIKMTDEDRMALNRGLFIIKRFIDNNLLHKDMIQEYMDEMGYDEEDYEEDDIISEMFWEKFEDMICNLNSETMVDMTIAYFTASDKKKERFGYD